MESPQKNTLRRAGSSPVINRKSPNLETHLTKRDWNKGGDAATPVSSILSQQAHQTMLKNWSRPISKLTVFKDLPRLSRGLRVIDGDGVLLFEDNKEEERHSAVPKIMIALAELLDDAHVSATMRKEVAQMFTSGDIQQNLTKFFQDSRISKESRTMRILKCFQQEMVSAAYELLRATVYEKFPFKDKAKTWKVQIEITPNTVIVTHRKSEQSHASEPSQSFSFEWCTQLDFGSSLSSFTAHLFILDYHFPEFADANMQQQLSALFEPRLKQTHPYQKILNKSCADLRLLSHLNKYLHKIEVLDSRQKPLFRYNRNESSSSNLWQLIIDISLALGEDYDDVEQLIARAGESIDSDGKPGLQIKEFLRLAETEGMRTIQVLKCIHPEMKAVGSRKLRSALTASGFNMRESGDKWNCSVQVLETEVLVNHNTVTPGWNAPVRDPNRSSSQGDLEIPTSESSPSVSAEPKPNKTFEISWNVCLAFSMSLRRFECNMSVLDFKFDGRKTELNDFKRCIQPWVSKEVQFYRLLCKDPKEYQVMHTLPKTAANTTIFSHSKVIFSGDQDVLASYRILRVLAEQLQPDLLSKVHSARSAFKDRVRTVSPDQAPSVLRERLFDFFLKDLPFATSPVGRLLRALDRQMLALAMATMREALKDKPVEFIPKEKWSVAIRFSGKKIKVCHYRDEILRLTDCDSSEEAECSFSWRLELCFDRLISEIQSTNIAIVDWELQSTMKQDLKQKLADAMAPLVPDYVPYERTMKMPFKQCNIGSDLLYAAKHMEITGLQNKVIHRPAPESDTNRIQSIKDCFGTLFHHFLADPLRTTVLSALSRCLEAKSDPAAALELFCRTLIDDKITTDDSELCKLLRLITQVAVTPAVNALRKEYHSQFPYRPVKGSWKIAVRILSEPNCVEVTHTREEQSSTEDPEGFFAFQWQVQLTLSRRSQKLRSKFQINTLDFQEQTSYTTRAQLLAAFKDLAGKNRNISTDSNAVSLEAVDCVRLLLQTLRATPQPPRINVRADLRGLSSIALLEGLEKALVQQSDKSLRVMIQPPPATSRRVSSLNSSDMATPRAAMSPAVRKSLNAHRVSLTASASPVLKIDLEAAVPTSKRLILSSPRKMELISSLPSPRSAPDLRASVSMPLPE